jgi:hypothetical protein
VTSDVARLAAPAADTTGPSLTQAPCSAVLGFIDKTIADVFNAIGHLPYPVTYENDGWFTRFLKAVGTVLAAGANFLIDQAKLVISKTVSVAIKPILNMVAQIAGVVGTVAVVVSAVTPWTMTLTADPATNRKGIEPEGPREGTVTATIDLGGLDQWPTYLADCAARAGATLPPLKPAGNHITWDITGARTGLAYLGDGDTALRDDATAHTQYITAVERKRPNARRTTGIVLITATVQRDDLTKIQNQFEDLVHRNLRSLVPPLGSIIDDVAWPVVQPWVDRAFDTLSHLRDVTGGVSIPISYHVAGEPTPTPKTPVSRPSATGHVPARCPSDALVGMGYRYDETLHLTVATQCVYRNSVTSLEIDLVPGVVLPGGAVIRGQGFQPVTVAGADAAGMRTEQGGSGPFNHLYVNVGRDQLGVSGTDAPTALIALAERILRAG